MKTLLTGGFLALLLLVGQPAEEKQITNSLGMQLVRIEPGRFVMGQVETEPGTCADWHQRDGDEAPAHRVEIRRPFHLGAHEVTNAQYEQFDPAHRKFRGLAGVSKEATEPVTFVTWQQAVDFCRWLS